MSAARSLLPEGVERYLATVIARETRVERELRRETAALPEARMPIGADQGAFFTLLLHAIGARTALEIGTFTGYSALAIAKGLPPDGRLITCDVSSEWTAIARRYWREAGVAERIELRIGPAVETLSELLRERGKGSFDFAFIDADKPAYDQYYEACLQLVRPGGVIAIDNTLWSGAVADASDHDPKTEALRALNLKVRDDRRVESSLVSIGDGVMLVRPLAGAQSGG